MPKVNTIVLYVFMSCLFLGGCSKPPQFDKARIDMSLQSLRLAYPDLRQIDDVKDKEGRRFFVFQRSSGDIAKAQYYVSGDKLMVAAVLFSKGMKFDSLIAELTESNGQPDQNLNVMGSKAAAWEKGENFISVISGTTRTEIQLPTGETVMLEPEEIVLILGKK